MTGNRRLRRVAHFGVLALLAGLVALPAVALQRQEKAASPNLLGQVSQGPVVRYWLAHPDQAPATMQGQLQAARSILARFEAPSGAAGGGAPALFNHDSLGLPQNEESVSVCRNNPSNVIEGTNDYRGLIDSEGNFTGWHFSNDGGATVAKEGLLPPVVMGGENIESGGDPVFAADPKCNLYAVDLNYDFPDGGFPYFPNGIGAYKTTPPKILAGNCGDEPGGDLSDEDCWPTAVAVATAPNPTHFYDKPWFDVGNTGDGKHVWVAFSDFEIHGIGPLDFTAEIFAVRCNGNLGGCTSPIPISVDDTDVQFSDVTIGPDGRTYITWVQVRGELEEKPQKFILKMRVAQPGATTFGPERLIYKEKKPLPFGGFLHANDFRIATVPKNAVTKVGGEPRVYVVWDGCSARPLGSICEEPRILLTHSDDFGATWSTPKVISKGGDNFFPTIAADRSGPNLAVAYFTHKFDATFHNREDVELVTIDKNTSAVVARQRITPTSNETEADPLLGGFFIGDYIEVAANEGTAYVSYNANYRSVKLLGMGFKIPQQDNYLAVVDLTP